MRNNSNSFKNVQPKKDCTLGNHSFEMDKDSIEDYKRKAGYPKNFIGCIEPSLPFKYLNDETDISNE